MTDLRNTTPVAGDENVGCAPRPKILLVGSALGGGGAETRLRLLGQRLFGGGGDIALFNDKGSGVPSVGKNLIPLGWTGRMSYPSVVLRLRKAIRAGKYDAALAMGLHQNVVLWAATQGLRERPAIILTETTRPNTNGLQDTGLLTYWVRRIFYNLSYRAADLVAANSIDGVAEVVNNYGVEQSRIRRIPNLVEPNQLLRESRDVIEPDPTPSFCMATRLDKMKRVDTLLEAAAGLPAGLAWRIDIVGDGPHRSGFEALAVTLAIAERVRFHGWRKNPYPFMARARATVVCSTYEGFSNTVLESMALGTPVVTSFCSSDAEDMASQGAALGFPVGDHSALRVHLRRLLTDTACRAALVSTSARYIERHTVPSSILEYEALLRDAIIVRKQGLRRTL